jgi:hypothetical protein
MGLRLGAWGMGLEGQRFRISNFEFSTHPSRPGVEFLVLSYELRTPFVPRDSHLKHAP